jgi:hypothetical protein
MLNGVHKKISNLVMNYVTYLRDTTLEVVSKPHLRPYSRVTNGSAELVTDLLNMLTEESELKF